MRRYGRREALLRGLGLMAAAGAISAGCAAPAPPTSIAPAELYVGLARERVVAILNTVTDRVVQRISLAALGREGHLSQIAVAPGGNAVVLPITGSSADLGFLCPPAPASAPAASTAPASGKFRRGRGAEAPAAAGKARCARVPVVEGNASDAPAAGSGPTETVCARQMVADARGHAYVVVGDALGAAPGQLAVVDLAGGHVLRHLPLTAAGDRVGALAVTPDGSRLFAAVYGGAWPLGGSARGGESNRIVALDTRDGRVCAQTALPEGAGAVGGLALAAAPSRAPNSPPAAALGLPLSIPAAVPAATPPGAGRAGQGVPTQALYVALSDQPPRFLDDDSAGSVTRPALLALDGELLETLDLWPLDRSPAGLAVLPDGRRAYALLVNDVDGPWSRELLSLDLAGGASRRWPIPGGAFALVLNAVGKLYIADTIGDRLWRLDTRTDTLLPPLSLPGAPLALGSRPA